MKVRLLKTTGNGKYEEISWIKPEISENEIEVKAQITGICRSDIDMMIGDFGPLPENMQGHEGLGIVTKIGHNITDVKVGDYVATRGEPAFADYYNVRKFEYVKVPELSSKYILEPVACGINIIDQPLKEIANRSGPGKRLLILGSGFLAWVAYNTILLYHLDFEITVVGNSNKEIWGEKLSSKCEGTFDVVIDLSSDKEIFEYSIFNNESLIIFGTQKQINTDFSNILWKACTIIFPSPRTNNFYQSMKNAAYWIEQNSLNIDKFWTKQYNRDTEWDAAFMDGLNRPKNYSRGYLCWTQNSGKM